MDNRKASRTVKISTIIVGVVDVILIGFFVFVILLTSGGKSVGVTKATLNKDFLANDLEYQNLGSTLYSFNDSIKYEVEVGANTNGDTQADDSNSDSSTINNQVSVSSDGFVFPNSDTVLLTDDQLSNTLLDPDTCRLAINEIYARHGFLFTKEANLQHFNQYDWYVNMTKESDMDVVSSNFSSIEKENVAKLQAFENANGWNQ